MSAAWFGLIGVIVGGVISSIWSWLALVRQELSDGMVAARIVDRDLSDRQVAMELRHGASHASSVWVDNRVALAKVLGKPQWDAVADAYRDAGRDTDAVELSAARAALKDLVAGKRYIVPQRWRNMLHLRQS